MCTHTHITFKEGLTNCISCKEKHCKMYVEDYILNNVFIFVALMQFYLSLITLNELTKVKLKIRLLTLRL